MIKGSKKDAILFESRANEGWRERCTASLKPALDMVKEGDGLTGVYKDRKEEGCDFILRVGKERLERKVYRIFKTCSFICQRTVKR